MHDNSRAPLKRFLAAIGLVLLLYIPIVTVIFLQRVGGAHQLRPGERVPALTLRSLDSLTVSILGLSGKRAALLFFSPDCPRCRQEISNINRLFRAYNDKYVFTGISSGSAGQTRDFVNAHEIVFPIFLDGNGEAKKAFGVFEVPTLFLVRADGVIAYVGTGAEPLEARRRLLADDAGEQGK